MGTSRAEMRKRPGRKQWGPGLCSSPMLFCAALAAPACLRQSLLHPCSCTGPPSVKVVRGWLGSPDRSWLHQLLWPLSAISHRPHPAVVSAAAHHGLRAQQGAAGGRGTWPQARCELLCTPRLPPAVSIGAKPREAPGGAPAPLAAQRPLPPPASPLASRCPSRRRARRALPARPRRLQGHPAQRGRLGARHHRRRRHHRSKAGAK